MKIFNKTLLLTAGLFLSLNSLKAQLNPLTSQYYNNTYLGNPAFAGYEKGLNINAAYRKQWSGFPGSPSIQNLTFDYGKNKAALGININFEKSGLQGQSRVVGTYAYHLPLNNEGKTLHFGLSFGFTNQTLANGDIVGNNGDPLAVAYNQRETYLDGDFGIGYTSNKFRIEASIPNLKTFFKKEVINLADQSTFYTASSYKIDINEGADGIGIEPKVVYRGYRKLKNIWDLGTEVTVINKQIVLTAIYHSTKSTSFGLGLDYKKKYLISSFYSTQTSALTSYSNGSFEINLRGRF